MQERHRGCLGCWRRRHRVWQCPRRRILNRYARCGLLAASRVRTHTRRVFTERGPLGGVWVYFYALVDNVASAGLWENDQLLADTVRAAQTTSKSLGACVLVLACLCGGVCVCPSVHRLTHCTAYRRITGTLLSTPPPPAPAVLCPLCASESASSQSITRRTTSLCSSRWRGTWPRWQPLHVCCHGGDVSSVRVTIQRVRLVCCHESCCPSRVGIHSLACSDRFRRQHIRHRRGAY